MARLVCGIVFAGPALLALSAPDAALAQGEHDAPPLLRTEVHVLEHIGRDGGADRPDAHSRLAARVLASAPLAPLRQLGPPADGARHRVAIDLGSGDLLLQAFRVRTPSLDGGSDAPHADRVAAWGGGATMAQPIGPDDSLSLTVSAEQARRRSSFAPQYAQPFRSQTAAVTLGWQHGAHLALGAGYRVTRDSGIDTPVAAAAYRAAGGDPAGNGAHLFATITPFTSAPAGRRPTIDLDLFARNRTGVEFASAMHETGATATLHIRF